MSEDYQPGKFEDGFILSEEKFSKSMMLACVFLDSRSPGGGGIRARLSVLRVSCLVG